MSYCLCCVLFLLSFLYLYYLRICEYSVSTRKNQIRISSKCFHFKISGNKVLIGNENQSSAIIGQYYSEGILFEINFILKIWDSCWQRLQLWYRRHKTLIYGLSSNQKTTYLTILEKIHLFTEHFLCWPINSFTLKKKPVPISSKFTQVRVPGNLYCLISA